MFVHIAGGLDENTKGFEESLLTSAVMSELRDEQPRWLWPGESVKLESSSHPRKDKAVKLKGTLLHPVTEVKVTHMQQMAVIFQSIYFFIEIDQMS